MNTVARALEAWREAERRLEELERTGDEKAAVEALADVLIARREYHDAFERAVAAPSVDNPPINGKV